MKQNPWKTILHVGLLLKTLADPFRHDSCKKSNLKFKIWKKYDLEFVKKQTRNYLTIIFRKNQIKNY